MRTGEQKVARAYVIYREQRATARQQTNANHHPTLQILDAQGQLQPLDLTELTATITKAAEGLKGLMFKQLSMKPLKTCITA
jgi:ribonucleoside-diphosphate reductase alpha chain